MPRSPNFTFSDVSAYLKSAAAEGRDISVVTPTEIQTKFGGRFRRCAELLATAKARAPIAAPLSGCSLGSSRELILSQPPQVHHPAQSSECIDGRLAQISRDIGRLRELDRQLRGKLEALEDRIAAHDTAEKQLHQAGSEILQKCMRELQSVKLDIADLKRLIAALHDRSCPWSTRSQAQAHKDAAKKASDTSDRVPDAGRQSRTIGAGSGTVKLSVSKKSRPSDPRAGEAAGMRPMDTRRPSSTAPKHKRVKASKMKSPPPAHMVAEKPIWWRKLIGMFK
jgi:hypothetical protein